MRLIDELVGNRIQILLADVFIEQELQARDTRQEQFQLLFGILRRIAEVGSCAVSTSAARDLHGLNVGRTSAQRKLQRKTNVVISNGHHIRMNRKRNIVHTTIGQRRVVRIPRVQQALGTRLNHAGMPIGTGWSEIGP